MIDETTELQGAISGLNNQLLSKQTLEETLHTVSMLAKDTIDGAEEVSVTVWQTKPYTIAFTGESALNVDKTQYKTGEGPCLEAIRQNQVFDVPDMEKESRWRKFAEKALDQGFKSSYSVPLAVEAEALGAMNVYGIKEFTDAAQQAAHKFASAVGVSVANVVAYEQARRLADQLQEAMQSRSIIDQAKGILMATRRCTADEAFESLRLASQHSNRKLRDIALELTQRFTTDTPPNGDA